LVEGCASALPAPATASSTSSTGSEWATNAVTTSTVATVHTAIRIERPGPIRSVK